MTGSAPSSTDRLAKLFVDLGEETSLRDANQRLGSTRLQLVLSPQVPESETLQLCAFLAAETAIRAFPAGVRVVLSTDGTVRTPCRAGQSLSAAFGELGAEVAALDESLPTVAVGDVKASIDAAPAVRAVPRGWAGGILPLSAPPVDYKSGPLGAVLAGSLAVGEVFLAIHRLEPRASTRSCGISTWAPAVSWMDEQAVGPPLEHLPSRVWLVGLGHLGQAFAWLLRALPYATPSDVLVALQDTDVVDAENVGTSLLATADVVGDRKARVVDAAMRGVGFDTLLVERRMEHGQHLQHGEPRFALTGLDSAAARRPLSSIGWAPLIDTGIGAGAQDFTQIVIQRLTEERQSQVLFDVPATDRADRLLAENPAYRDRLAAGEDRCGLLTAAGEAVGTAFVGAAASAMAFAEALRPLHEGPAYDIVSVDLRDPEEVATALQDLGDASWPPYAPARPMRE